MSYALARPATTKVLELIEDGVLDWKSLAEECIARMSEDDVQEMAEELGWLDEEEEEDEELEDYFIEDDDEEAIDDDQDVESEVMVD